MNIQKFGNIIQFLMAVAVAIFLLWVIFGFKNDCELSPKCLKEEMEYQKIYFPEVTLRIAILETGWFKSEACIKKHNLFGFMLNGKTMYFDSYKSCIKYYHNWEVKHFKFNENYLDFLKRIHYFNDKDYIWKLKKINIIYQK